MARIVLADDSPDLLSILGSRFRAHGHDVHEARDGAEALDVIRAERPDIIVLDVMMPELNGYQVCRRLKAEPELAKIPVILLTAKDSEADRFWGGEVGAAVFLSKPVDPARVVAEVERLLAET